MCFCVSNLGALPACLQQTEKEISGSIYKEKSGYWEVGLFKIQDGGEGERKRVCVHIKT